MHEGRLWQVKHVYTRARLLALASSNVLVEFKLWIKVLKGQRWIIYIGQAMISEVFVDKPSWTLNLVYMIFGYFLASSIISTSSELSFDQNLVIIALSGGIFGTFLFYAKPVERVLLFLLILREGGTEMTSLGGSTGSEFTLSTRESFSSPLLAEEKAKINGAFFFSLSILLSDPLLERANIHQPFIILLVFASIMMIIAIWEGITLVRDKLPSVTAYYNFCRFGRTGVEELRRAIKGKDWPRARGIMARSFDKELAYAFYDGLCVKCRKIFERANFCPDCGEKLLTHCKKCHETIAIKGMKKFPKYCMVCGSSIS